MALIPKICHCMPSEFPHYMEKLLSETTIW